MYVLKGLYSRFKSKPLLVIGAVFMFYAALAVVMTWPFALHPTNTMVAPFGGDIAGSISKYEALKEAHQNPLFDAKLHWLTWPAGPMNNVGVDRVSLFSTLFLWVGSDLFGTILTHSWLSFIGYVFTAGAAFLLVLRITGSKQAGLVAGVIYGFWPTMYGMTISDMTYAQMWLYLIPVWAFWELATQGYSRTRMAVAALSIVPAVFWTPYYMFHVLVVGSTCLGVAAYYLRRLQGWRTAALVGAVTGTFWILVLAIYRYVGLHSPSTLIPDRKISDFYEESAQPLMYLFPGAHSWGPHGNWLLVHLVPRAAVVNLYVGLSTLALAAVGVVILVRSRWRGSRSLRRQQRPLLVAAVMATWVAAVCLVFSLPPIYKFGPLKIRLPGDLVAHIVPALRAGQRFVMPIEGVLAVLAGIGVALLLARAPKRWRLGLTLLITIIVFADLWAPLPDSITPIKTYPALVQLGRLPMGPVVWFEHGSMFSTDPRRPCLLQHEYRKPLIDDCALGQSPNLATLLGLPLCDAVTGLQAVGTRYVVMSPSDVETRSCLNQRAAGWNTVANDSTFLVGELPKLSRESAERAKEQLGLK
jgi:hypothetical protein